MSTGGTHIRLGTSTRQAPRAAAAEAATTALRQAAAPVIALVFATPQYAPDELAEGLHEALGPVPWAGCTAPGVFAGVALMTEGIVVAVVDSGHVRARVGVSSHVRQAPREAGRLAVARALDGMPGTPNDRTRLVVLLPDTNAGAAAEVVRGALSEGGNGVVWAGGGAGDLSNQCQLVQFADGMAHSDSVVAVVIDLPGSIATGVRHGWSPFGPPAMVTRAAGNIVSELEYRAAFEVYRETASIAGVDLTTDGFIEYAMLHPLGIPQANDQYLIRDPIELVDSGLRCVVEVPDGALVRVMRANHDEIIRAAGDAAEQALRALDGPPAGALIFDCISRHLILGAAYRDELVAFRDALGPDVPIFGCLTFGEIASFEREVPQFHNKTTVVVALPSGDDAP